jgi:hypothetical protein
MLCRHEGKTSVIALRKPSSDKAFIQLGEQR